VTNAPDRRATVPGVTILKQLAFSIAFAAVVVAVAEYIAWILEQNGWINP
jgi:hypothetical protein